MLTTPKNIGYAVFWETGDTDWQGNPRKDSYYTKSREDAERQKATLESKGVKNVTLTEAIF